MRKAMAAHVCGRNSEMTPGRAGLGWAELGLLGVGAGSRKHPTPGRKSTLIKVLLSKHIELKTYVLKGIEERFTAYSTW